MKIIIAEPDQDIGEWKIEDWDVLLHGTMPAELIEELNEAFAKVYEQGRKAGRDDVIQVINDKTFFMMRDTIVPIIQEQLSLKDAGSDDDESL